VSHHAHPVRPADLVGLISFDGAVTENEAVPRRRLGRPSGPPHAIGAALSQWLRRDRHTWVDMSGRHVNGIATARALTDDGGAWEIEALVAAPPDGAAPGAHPDPAIARRLLEQAVAAAQEAHVGRVLLRLRPTSPAAEAAAAAGFRRACRETLWCAAHPLPPRRGEADAGPAVTLRPLGRADRHAEYELFRRAMPPAAREALALTFAEWEGIADHDWVGRPHAAVGAWRAETLVARLRWGFPGRAPRIVHADLLADPALGGPAAGIGAALLDVMSGAVSRHDGWLALHAEADGAWPAALAARPGATHEPYVLYSARVQRPLRVALPDAGVAAIPQGGV